MNSAAVDAELGDDAQPFDEWYHREYRRVVALVYTLAGSRTAAEELAQDAFLEAHRRWGTISGHADPGGWVRKVAMNKARSAFRRRAAEARAYAKHLGRERVLPSEMPDSSHEFWAAVRELPAKQAQVIALHYLEDRPVDDIANVLDISPGTVKTHLHRGRQNLAVRLGHEEERP
ncbi:MAG: sigma-70 family RNA polymerase sigma factor [Actinomycetota bacterium]